MFSKKKISIVAGVALTALVAGFGLSAKPAAALPTTFSASQFAKPVYDNDRDWRNIQWQNQWDNNGDRFDQDDHRWDRDDRNRDRDDHRRDRDDRHRDRDDRNRDRDDHRGDRDNHHDDHHDNH